MGPKSISHGDDGRGCPLVANATWPRMAWSRLGVDVVSNSLKQCGAVVMSATACDAGTDTEGLYAPDPF